jgi:hypothetical protein
LAIEIPALPAASETQMEERSAWAGGTVKLGRIRWDSSEVVVSGEIDGLAATEISNLSFRDVRLVLDNGDVLTIADAHFGFGPESKAFELRFVSDTGIVNGSPARMSLPPALGHEAAEIAME